MLMESAPRSFHRIGILPGLQLRGIQSLQLATPPALETLLCVFDQRYPRCPSVAVAVVG